MHKAVWKDHPFYGKLPAEEGYYWCFNLDKNGNRCQTSPTVVFFNAEEDILEFIGDEHGVQPRPTRHELFGPIKFEGVEDA